MGTVPKKFICEKCKNESYNHFPKCLKCKGEDTIIPIPADYYQCYINGKFYGGGSLKFIHELFTDYVLTHNMYGREKIEFKITKNKMAE